MLLCDESLVPDISVMPSFLKYRRSQLEYIFKLALDGHFYSKIMYSVCLEEQRSVKFIQQDASNSART